LLSFETDCWDVHAALEGGDPDVVLLDVRSAEAFAAGHVPGAINLPHRRMVERNLAAYPADALFVVYCAGPHCNGADRAAAKRARPDLVVGEITSLVGSIRAARETAPPTASADNSH